MFVYEHARLCCVILQGTLNAIPTHAYVDLNTECLTLTMHLFHNVSLYPKTVTPLTGLEPRTSNFITMNTRVHRISYRQDLVATEARMPPNS